MKGNSMKHDYEIKISEHIHPCWQEWFEGWVITERENDEVLMRKSGVDHAELHGILNKIRDLNLTIVSVTQIDYEP